MRMAGLLRACTYTVRCTRLTMKERLMCVLGLPHLGFSTLTTISRRIIKLANQVRVTFAAAAHLLPRALLYFLQNIAY
jgi:hypothetical protein